MAATEFTEARQLLFFDFIHLTNHLSNLFRHRPQPIRLRASHLLWPVWLTPGWIALWLAVSLPVDGQAPMEPIIGGQVTDTSRKAILHGLGVFGKVLGIHGSDSLRVAGDLVLDRAEVVGEGVLLLKNRWPQQLISTHSMLANLAIDNPTQVALRGDLRIQQSLTIKKGTFSTTEGVLTLDPACQTRLLAGGQLKAGPIQAGPIVRTALPITRMAISQPDNGLTARTPALPAPVGLLSKQSAYATPAAPRYASLTHEKPVPPPEAASL